MKNIYNGHIRNREELEAILGDQLPKKAEIWFAWSFRQPTGPKESTYNVLAYWSLDKRFYGVAAVRTIFDGNATPWKINAFMFNPNAKDPRAHLQTELDRQQAQRIASKDPSKVTLIESALIRMVAYEYAWSQGKEKPDEDVIQSVQHLPSDGLPPVIAN